MLEDLFLALYLATLAPVLGGADTAGEAVLLFARAAGFLIVLGLAARYGTRVVGRVIEGRDDELLVILTVGFALLVAGVAFELGVSDAIGAFMAGVILAGTAAAKRVERLVTPLRDAFAALFFFAFGLSIDPGDIGGVAGPALAAIGVSLVLAGVAGVVDRAPQPARPARGHEHRVLGARPWRVRAHPHGARHPGGPRRAADALRGAVRPRAGGGQPDHGLAVGAHLPAAPPPLVPGPGAELTARAGPALVPARSPVRPSASLPGFPSEDQS